MDTSKFAYILNAKSKGTTDNVQWFEDEPQPLPNIASLLLRCSKCGLQTGMDLDLCKPFNEQLFKKLNELGWTIKKAWPWLFIPQRKYCPKCSGVKR